MVDGLLSEQPARQGPAARAARRAGPRPARRRTTDPHRSVDDAPFGGGAGMVLMPEPIFAAVEAVDPPRPLFLLSAGGRRFDQAVAARAGRRRRVLAAVRPLRGRRRAGGRAPGRRRAVDRRLRAGRRRGGRAGRGRGGGPARARRDGQRGVGRTRSPSPTGLLEYPQYTRPAEFRGWDVPEVLRSGDHGRIARWRRAQALRPHARAPARPHRGPGRAHRRGARRCWRSSARTRRISCDRPPDRHRLRSLAP